MKAIETHVDIAAEPERVWAVLTDIDAYPEWNPFITRVEGVLERGRRLEVRIEPPDGRGMTFRPKVLRVEKDEELRWLGRLLVPRILDGEHSFRLEPGAGGRTRFVQSEEFRGVLTPLLGRMLERTRRGFDVMNEALKRRVEDSSPSGGEEEAT